MPCEPEPWPHVCEYSLLTRQNSSECGRMSPPMANTSNVASLILFFVGVALCFWRVPRADRKHVILCIAAGVLWCSLPIFEPSMRRSGYGLVVASFLIIGLTQPLRRRAETQLPR